MEDNVRVAWKGFALSAKLFREHRACARRPGIILDQRDLPACRAVKADRGFISGCRDGFETETTERSAVFFEGLIQDLANAAATKVRMNTDQVHIPSRRIPRGDEPKEKAHHHSVGFHHARQ